MLERGNIRAWVANGVKPGDRYVAIFNLGESAEKLQLKWPDLGIAEPVHSVRDLWSHKDLSPSAAIQVPLKPHASVLYRHGRDLGRPDWR